MIAREVVRLLMAVQFLTRIPVPASRLHESDWLTQSAKYFPLVGALIGLISGAAGLFSAVVLPDPLPVVVALATAMALTGALHEDGLADTADAFGGGATTEARLAIMKDPRIGTYGTLALIAILAFKGGALTAIDPLSVARVLIGAHAASRLAVVFALAALPYAGAPDTAKVASATRLGLVDLAIALAFGLTAGILVLRLPTFVVGLFAAALAATIAGLYARRMIGGYTGDVLGAIEQIAETAFIVAAAALIAGPG